MRRTCVVVALAMASVACGTIDFWITETPAFSNPADYFDRSEKDFLPNYLGAGPATTVPVDMGPCGGGMEKTFFVWGSFNNEELYTRIYGLQVCVKVDGCMQLMDSAIYRHAKTTGPPAQQWIRWDQASGIFMGPGCVGTGIALGWFFSEGIWHFDNPYDLMDNGGQDFLLGAFKVKCNGPGFGGHAYLGIGTLGIICDLDGEDVRPVLNVLGQTCPANPPSQCFWVEAAYCTPEPAALLMLAIGGLLLRRR